MMNPPVGLERTGLRVGVLPFLAGEDEDLALDVSQAIATQLKEFHWFDVVSPLAGQAPLTGQAAAAHLADRTLKSGPLDYVVEGAVYRDGKHAQLILRLLDVGECARSIWSERLELPVAKLPRWSKLIAKRIVAGMDPCTSFFDGRPKQRRRNGATALLMIAIPLMFKLERRKYEEAGRLIERALEIEPDNAMITAWSAFWQVVYFGQGWTLNLEKASAIAQIRARRAITLSPDDPEILTICGHVSSFLCKDYDLAQHYFDRALKINPNLEPAWCWSAATYSYIGKSGIALERLKQFQDLSTGHPHYVWTRNIHSVSYAFAGDYERAVESARRVIRVSPMFVNGYKPLIASLGHLGRVEEAKPYVDKLLAIEPNFSLERFAKVYPIKYDSDREHYMKGLRLAGIPER
jgi:tetratricopeptide (TPR) repeat protein